MKISHISENGMPVLLHEGIGLQIDEEDERALAVCSSPVTVKAYLERKFHKRLTENERVLLSGWLADPTLDWSNLKGGSSL